MSGHAGSAAPGRLWYARAWLAPFGLLAGFMLGLKLTGLFLVLPFALWLGVRAWRPDFGPVLRAAGLCIVAGASSYVYALILTGNPVFPLLNDLFQSPNYAHERLQDLGQVRLGDARRFGNLFGRQRPRRFARQMRDGTEGVFDGLREHGRLRESKIGC